MMDGGDGVRGGVCGGGGGFWKKLPWLSGFTAVERKRHLNL